MYNLSSRILLNILLPNFEAFLRTNFNFRDFATSPLMNFENSNFEYHPLCAFGIHRGREIYSISLYSSDTAEERNNKLIEYVKENLYNVRIILDLLFRSECKIELTGERFFDKTIKEARIDISIKTGDYEYIISLIMPFEFFKLFSKKDIELTIENIEKSIIGFFKNPMNLFPELKIILNSLNELEIQRLFFYLQKKNSLTPYQIVLMLLSFPEHTLLIKNNLSSNIVSDVNKMMKKFSINKRDLTGGIYSVEESIFNILRQNEDFNYSGFFSEISKRLKILLNASVYKDFYLWIKEMNSADQLYQTISITKEDDIVNSISDNPDLYYNIFAKVISEKKLKDIFSVIKSKKISFTERIESRAVLVSNYKKNRIRRLNLGHDNFFGLISILYREDIVNLLLEAGWFTLSTALKEMDKKKAFKLIERLPLGARYLIIDVLQGIVNPNIIHDEMQIKKARAVCVNKLASLYIDGFINL